MSHKCIIEVSEHETINHIDDIKLTEDTLKEFDKEMKSLKYLGIYRDEKDILETYRNSQSETLGTFHLKAHYIIGYRWFEQNDSYIYVAPKIHKQNKKQTNYMKMFMECLKHSEVSKKLNKTYKIFFEEPFIEIENQKDEITLLLVLHFLHLVKSIAKKGLKKGYVKVTENLTSKIKGKVLINQTIKQNHLKNRVDKTVCNHQIFTINCLENRILKTALMQCSRHIQVIEDQEIRKMLYQNISSFELVEEKEVFDSDFFKIKHSPFYKEYKEALSLAKMIFKRFGFVVNSKTSHIQQTMIPPYYINMPELFERYAEVKLKEQGYDDLIDGNVVSVAQWSMRPDFLSPSRKMIIDAKYKFWYENGKNGNGNENADYKDDYMQLSLYGRDKKIRKNIGLDNSNEEAQLLFVYPVFDNKIKGIIQSRKFNNISKLAIEIKEEELD